MNETPEPASAVEPDFYVDGSGLYVFTSTYLRRRGTCCGNKCRHCPFDWRNVPTPQVRRGERPVLTAPTGRS